MKQLILYSIALLLLASCKKDNDSATSVELRVWNATSGTIFECEVNPGSPTGIYNYGRIGLDSLSNYRSFTQAYSYGYVNFILNNKAYRIQPIDYVGETPLKNGKYTYKLTLSSTDGLGLTLIKD